MPSQTAYLAAVERIRAQVDERVRAMWNRLPNYRDLDIDRFVAAVVPLVQAGQLRVAELTSAYFETGGVDRALVLNGRGVDPSEVYRRPAVTVYTELAAGKSMSEAVKAGAARLSSLAATDLQMAKVRQAQASLTSKGVKQYRRVLTGNENCALCVIASTQRYWVRNLSPIHPGCVPGDSVISPIPGGSAKLSDFAWGEVQAVSRRLFQGELIEFVTASGNEVRVTPNHPVLTEKGWVPAHLLSEGDAVFRSSIRERVVSGGPDVDERPALAEDVFDAARVAFPLVRVPLAAEDFHADGADGEVEIVYTYGNFPTPGDAEIVQRLSERGFMHTHGGRIALDGGGAFSSFIPGGFAASGSGVGGGGLGSYFFGGHFGGAELSGSTSPTRFDAPAEKFSPESRPGYASQGMNLQRRLAGLVESDSIVELRRVSWSGHVFNLHTREGWYSSNNHIVSNCDCAVDEMPADWDPRKQVIDKDLLEQTHLEVLIHAGKTERRARDLGLGKRDASGRWLSDFTDLIVTRTHGEYGPVLTWRGQHFTGPADF